MGNWVNGQQQISIMDSNGNIITMLNQDWLDGQWENNDGSLDLQVSKNLTNSYPGYKIEVTYQGSSPVKEETNNNPFSLNCSPNPATGLININYTLTEPQPISFIIINSLGIEEARINDEQMQETGNYSFNYDVSNLAPGVYFLTLRAGNKIETKKFVVIR